MKLSKEKVAVQNLGAERNVWIWIAKPLVLFDGQIYKISNYSLTKRLN